MRAAHIHEVLAFSAAYKLSDQLHSDFSRDSQRGRAPAQVYFRWSGTQGP